MSGIRALLLLVSFVLPADSGAATVYQYVGNTFSIVTDGVPDSVNRISGFLRFDDALAPNLVNASSPVEWGVNLLAWEISDGLATASEIDGLLMIDPPLSGGAPRLSPLALSTDDDGAIIAWQFLFGTGLRVDPVPDATGVLSAMATRWDRGSPLLGDHTT